jgi:hypothetical protein
MLLWPGRSGGSAGGGSKSGPYSIVGKNYGTALLTWNAVPCFFVLQDMRRMPLQATTSRAGTTLPPQASTSLRTVRASSSEPGVSL